MLSIQAFLSTINNPLAIALLVIVFVAFIYQVYFYLRYIRLGCKVSPSQETTYSPAVSVVVCARNEHKNLRDYLSTLLHQDYPCYEVIVVDDSSEDGSDLLLERWSRQYSHLYHTFVPCGARVLSSKKLALTIGIKAAKHELILLTDADCRPESKYWIREMVQGFANERTEIVLGFSPYFEKKGILNRLIGFDTLFNGLQYMGMARSGKPYMGVGRNLSYRKSTFLKNKGFTSHYNIPSGDDDLFISQVANKRNTKVYIDATNRVESEPKKTWKNWVRQKKRHYSTGVKYKPQTNRILGLLLGSRLAYYPALI